MTGRKTPIKAAMAMAAAMLITAAAATARAASVVDTVLFNATTNVVGEGDEAPGIGTGFSATSGIGGDTVEDAFGNNNGGVEPDNFLFADGRVPDNADGDMGNAGESVDVIGWATTSPVVLHGYRLGVAPDGDNSGNRGTELVLFNVEGEQDDFWDNNGAAATTDRVFAVPQVGNNFALSVTHTTDAGARIFEVDAIVPDLTGVVVNTTIFNAASNTGGDDPAGLSINFSRSPTVGANADTAEDAFGNNDGAIEGSTLIFENFGTADSGNNAFDGGETVDFIAWHTQRMVQLDGYRLDVASDGGEDSNRSTELVRFFVEGVLVDIIDLNGFSGVFDRLFDGGTVTGNDFRIEFTRHGDGEAAGPRIVEIDALNAFAVPAPAALPAGLALMTLAANRRRRR